MAGSLIAIIIPVYNRAGVVRRTLDSVASQSYRPIHLVIVDNGSTDGTDRVVAEWTEANRSAELDVTIVNDPKRSASAARNRGFKEVKEPYVMFFDSDDVMLPGHVERAVNAFLADDTLDMVGWDISHELADGRVLRLPFADRDMLMRHLFNCILSTQRYAMRSDLLRRAGGWNESVKVWNDLELGVRLLMLNPNAKRLGDEVTVLTRVSSDSLTRERLSENATEIEHSLDCCGETLRQHGISERAIELRRIIVAAIYSREGDERGKKLQREVLDRQPSLLTRIALRAAYHYTRLGGRGVHYLFKRWITCHPQVLQP
jgi:glycosyltransferase involved in cell wall biosynthesis